MKKIIALLLAVMMVVGLFAACGKTPVETKPNSTNGTTTAPAGTTYKVAMITDYGDITDQSFNQTTWEACVKSVRTTTSLSSTTSPLPTTPPAVLLPWNWPSLRATMSSLCPVMHLAALLLKFPATTPM